MPMFALLSGWEVGALVVLAIIMFGAKKLPELARSVGKSLTEFKKASREVTDEIERAGNEPPASPKPNPPADKA